MASTVTSVVAPVSAAEQRVTTVSGWGAVGDTDEGQIGIPAELRAPHPASRASTVSTGLYHALAIVGGGHVVAAYAGSASALASTSTPVAVKVVAKKKRKKG